MDPRVRKAVVEKIDSAIADTSDIQEILKKLKSITVSNSADFAFGIAMGRIYNSFHYQTRRTLKRNATDDEFTEFLEILRQNANAIRAALEQQ